MTAATAPATAGAHRPDCDTCLYDRHGECAECGGDLPHNETCPNCDE